LPIIENNTEFFTEADYNLNAFKDINEPKKYLKNKASPLKKTQFKEDNDSSRNLESSGHVIVPSA
jgi:hypothetical protein